MSVKEYEKIWKTGIAIFYSHFEGLCHDWGFKEGATPKSHRGMNCYSTDRIHLFKISDKDTKGNVYKDTLVLVFP